MAGFGTYDATSYSWTVTLPWTINASTQPFKYVKVANTGMDGGETLSVTHLSIGAYFAISNATGTPMKLQINNGGVTRMDPQVTMTFAYNAAVRDVIRDDVVNTARAESNRHRAERRIPCLDRAIVDRPSKKWRPRQLVDSRHQDSCRRKCW